MINIKNNCGSITTTKINKALNSLSWVDKTFKEKYNRLNENNEIVESISCMTSPFSKNTENYFKLIAELENKYKELNNNNAKDFIKEVEEKTAILEKSIPIKDLTKNKEKLLKEKENYNTIQQKESKEKTIKEELKKRFNQNNRLITISLCYDNSDGMSDYYEPCRSIKMWIIKEIKEGKRDLRILKEEINKYPSLKSLNWNEHKENYSMNRFGYSLTSTAVDIPEDLKVKCYDGSKTNKGFYMVEFGSIQYNGYNELWNEKPEITENKTIELTKPITIKKNIEKNGIEIYFKEKPSFDVLELLKSKGFKWSFYNKCWYTKYKENIETQIKQLLNIKEVV